MMHNHQYSMTLTLNIDQIISIQNILTSPKLAQNFEQLHIAVFGGVYHKFNVFASGHSISNTNSKYTADIIQWTIAKIKW